MASENSGTKLAGLAQSRSPPLAPEPGSLLCFLAMSSNLAPFFRSAMIFLAWSSVSTRMWRALYSLPPLAATNLSYSAFTSASDTGLVLR
jgi:hypothetical protein